MRKKSPASSKKWDSPRKSQAKDVRNDRRRPDPLRIARGELIGRGVRVERSEDPTLEGLEGRVVDETLNTFVVERADGREVRVAKAPCVFVFETADGPVEIPGVRLRYRPEDRTKKVR